ncbi:uncharacterized protein K441DRAFT_699941 [Cenococcum geophilum 1.58]|uniref:uncharacterized protein n=1 Tax=Cenococcum geophilum 1.58 TaxID=794803 RepID=UPI00358E2DA7|nr:hypothetical protein K441DRAFT_699941 [Cenococcum geophilum 1.58]
MNVAMALMRDIETVVQQENVEVPFQYLNYAASWQNPLASYGAREMENGRRMARKYYYRGLFQRQVVGGFILLIPNLALDVGVVSGEDTYYIHVAAEAGGDRKS